MNRKGLLIERNAVRRGVICDGTGNSVFSYIVDRIFTFKSP